MLLALFLQLEKIEINNKILYVEIADNDEKRSLGLMFRKYLPDSVGMLFIFDSSGIYPFWMKNTYIPLSIAFIDENYKIIDIFDLEPLDETPIFPLKKFKYALEVNRNWFKRNDIRVGDKVKFMFLK
ncbi:MAG: DUF192 domain-containing protein [Candidatus Hydrothermia bacterium]|jgi:hypothetical protein|nr:DUF192 domain-containing protein [Candidatus Hydrothermia bacterium]